MAGTIIADFIRTDANQLSLNVGNTTFATINASGFFSNTGTQLIAANGKVSGASLISGSVTNAAFATAANTIPRSAMTSGAVLQVVQYRFTSTFSTSSTSFVDVTAFEATITPTSSSNKILVQVSVEAFHSAAIQDEFRILRNGSDPASISGGRLWFSTGFYGSATTGNGGTVFLDSPSSTSALTYKLQMRSRHGNTGYIGYDWNSDSPSGCHTLTLMEIAG